jgi:hypothetical protein
MRDLGMRDRIPDVGAADPELQNSPILDDSDEDFPELGGETASCYFNGVSYPLGQYVRSGDEVLQCVRPGVWSRQGEIPR